MCFSETICVHFQNFCLPKKLRVHLRHFSFFTRNFTFAGKTFAFPRETLYLFMNLLCSLKKCCVHLQNFCVPLKTIKSPNLFHGGMQYFSQCRVLGGNAKVLWANTVFLGGMLNFYKQMQNQCNIILFCSLVPYFFQPPCPVSGSVGWNDMRVNNWQKQFFECLVILHFCPRVHSH